MCEITLTSSFHSLVNSSGTIWAAGGVKSPLQRGELITHQYYSTGSQEKPNREKGERMIEDSKGGSRARQVHCRDMGCQPIASDLSRPHALLDLTLKPGVNGSGDGQQWEEYHSQAVMSDESVLHSHPHGTLFTLSEPQVLYPPSENKNTHFL